MNIGLEDNPQRIEDEVNTGLEDNLKGKIYHLEDVGFVQ